MAGLVLKEPISMSRRSLFDDVFGESDSLFSDVFGRNTAWSPWTKGVKETASYGPNAEVLKTEDGWIIKVDLPGMHKDDIKISLDGSMLNISGERKVEKESKDDDYSLRELTYGKFSRSFRVDEAVKSSDITASFKDGVLRLEVVSPKTNTKTQVQNIKIN